MKEWMNEKTMTEYIENQDQVPSKPEPSTAKTSTKYRKNQYQVNQDCAALSEHVILCAGYVITKFIYSQF